MISAFKSQAFSFGMAIDNGQWNAGEWAKGHVKVRT
jgi:hypothetical protein